VNFTVCGCITGWTVNKVLYKLTSSVFGVECISLLTFMRNLAVSMCRPLSSTLKKEVVSSFETFTDVYKSNIPKDSSLILFLTPQAKSESCVFLPTFLVSETVLWLLIVRSGCGLFKCVISLQHCILLQLCLSYSIITLQSIAGTPWHGVHSQNWNFLYRWLGGVYFGASLEISLVQKF
jgi:uncharacterized membrane protein (Fun14 family)